MTRVPTRPWKTPDAELRNIRFCDSEGNEVLEWTLNEPAIIECDLLLHRPLQQPNVRVNISSIGGVYLGSTNMIRAGLVVPGQPGTYRLRYILDPMPLADGDYVLQFVIADPGQRKWIWESRQPRAVSVRGCGSAGSILRCDGAWELVEAETPSEKPSPKVIAG